MNIFSFFKLTKATFQNTSVSGGANYNGTLSGEKRVKTEKRILLTSVRNAFIIIAAYIFYDFFIAHNIYRSIEGSFSFMVFLFCYWLLRKHFSNKIKKFVVALFLLNISAGFFFQGGLFGISSLDFCLFTVIVPTVFKSNERRAFFIFFFIEIIVLGYIQVFLPELIIDSRTDDPALVNVLEIFLRLANTTYFIRIFINLYNKEHLQVYETSRNLRTANKRIALYNKNLEEIVTTRTRTIQKLNDKLIEYAFFNSHKIRGPLARILGLVYLINLNSSKNGKQPSEELSEYLAMLNESAVELDIAIKEINLLLEFEPEKSPVEHLDIRRNTDMGLGK